MKGISKKQFDQIAKLVNPRMSAEQLKDIARGSGVSPSTVKAIRQAGTWGEYQRRRTVRSNKSKDAKLARKALEKVVSGKSARPELVTRSVSKRRRKHHSDKGSSKATPVKSLEVDSDLKKIAQAINKALDDADTKRPTKRAVVKRQSKHGVVEDPVPAYLLPDVQMNIPPIAQEQALSIKKRPGWFARLLGRRG